MKFLANLSLAFSLLGIVSLGTCGKAGKTGGLVPSEIEDSGITESIPAPTAPNSDGSEATPIRHSPADEARVAIDPVPLTI